MSKGIAYSITNDNVTVIIDGRPTVVARTAPNFVHLRDALLEEDWDDVRAHLRTGSSLARWARGRFSVVDNAILFDGIPVPSDFNARIVDMATAGESPEPLFNFWERLQRNPSRRSVEQLWRFLNLIGIPITDSGHFLAYKGVRTDYKDVHSGTIDNRPGQTVRVQRNQVSDDPNAACHYGLHVGSLDYASNWGPRVVIVKVDPEHVVCVPYDCSSQKMRVCEYEVVGLHGDGYMQSTSIPDSDWNYSDDFDGDAGEGSAPLDDDEMAKALGDAPFEQALRDADATVEPQTFFLNERHELPVRSKRTPQWIIRLDAADEVALHGTHMDTLRKYASQGLRIVGAYRIPGGKDGLVNAILKSRG